MAPTNRKQPTRAKSSESQMTFLEFQSRFPDDETCLEYLWTTRYALDGETAMCPKCDTERTFKRYQTMQQRQSWTCTTCGHHIHPTAGTIFHKSSTALHLWFFAIYIMSSTRCGVSAKQLERELGVTYKTAWRMFNLIRNQLMIQDDEPLSGEVEIDETYVGGRPRLKDREYHPDGRVKRGPSKNKPKTTVFGAVERGGKVRAEVVPPGETPDFAHRASVFVLPESSVFTDEFPAYNRLGDRFARHQRIQHKAKVYVRGDVHTQTIEGFWSLVKRGIDGAYHSVSAKWLQGYLNEYVWRYNHRDDQRAMFELLLLRAALPA
ncbi:MAG: IS1595 family transposase [Acidimicrobiia bacterium]